MVAAENPELIFSQRVVVRFEAVSFCIVLQAVPETLELNSTTENIKAQPPTAIPVELSLAAPTHIVLWRVTNHDTFLW